MAKRNFIKQFFKDKKMVGAVSPSTRFLGEKMLENIDFNTSKLIIELGPGTGIFTDEIIKRMANDAVLLTFELNDNFYESLAERIHDPRVTIIHDSAEFVQKYIDELAGGAKADVVVSSLPLMVFPENLRNAVVDVSHDCLKKNGIYVQLLFTRVTKVNFSRFKFN